MFPVFHPALLQSHEERFDGKGTPENHRDFSSSLEEYGQFVLPNDVPAMKIVRAAIVHVE